MDGNRSLDVLEACYNAQQLLLPCPKDLVYSSSRTSLLLLQERLLFLYKLKSEDLAFKNQVKSKSHRSIHSSIVSFGGSRSEVVLLGGGAGWGGVGGEGRNFKYHCCCDFHFCFHRKGIVVRVSASLELHRSAPIDLRVVFFLFFWTRRKEKFQL